MIVSSTQGSVTTPNPQLGNTDTVDAKVTIRRSMNGTAYGFKSTPTTSTHVLNINGMNPQVADDLITLIHNSVSANVVVSFSFNTYDCGNLVVENISGKVDMTQLVVGSTKTGRNITLTVIGDN